MQAESLLIYLFIYIYCNLIQDAEWCNTVINIGKHNQIQVGKKNQQKREKAWEKVMIKAALQNTSENPVLLFGLKVYFNLLLFVENKNI